MTASNGNIFHATGPLWWESTGHRWIPLTKASDAELLMLFLIWAWTNVWENNRDAGDLRRHLTHYGVTVMWVLKRRARMIASLLRHASARKQIVGLHHGLKLIPLKVLRRLWKNDLALLFIMISSSYIAPCPTELLLHDDVIKWKHFPCYWTFVRGIHRSPVNSPHKGQWRGPLMFSLTYAWINGWVNNHEAGHLRRHRAHYDVIVMASEESCYICNAFIYPWDRSHVMWDMGLAMGIRFLSFNFTSHRGSS